MDELEIDLKSTLQDLDLKAFKKCLYRKYNERLTTLNFTLEQLLKLSIEEVFKKLDLNLSLNRVLQNMGLASGEHLTLAGLLMFADAPQSFRPVFNMQCASFLGNDISGTEFRDKEVARNPIIHSTAQYILPYSGLGSGILRAISRYKDIRFENDVKGDRFKVIIQRIQN